MRIDPSAHAAVVGATVKGRRINGVVDAATLQPGDYGKGADGNWICRPPLNAQGVSYAGNLRNHTVTEHENGKITVKPSILQQYGDDENAWHGFLEFGVWRTC